MKLPSRLAKSRHGVYYYRFQYQEAGKRLEKRISLGTKYPAVAKRMAFQISAILNTRQYQQSAQTMTFDPNDPSTWGELSRANIQKLDINLPNGIQLKVHNQNDVRLAQQFIQGQSAINRKPLTDTHLSSEQTSLSESNEKVVSVSEMIKLYETRNAGRLAPKSLADYLSCQTRFAQWIDRVCSMENWPIALVVRSDIAKYIDYLIGQGVGLTTIKQKHLAALGGLFELAKSNGQYDEELPTRGHKVISKTDIRKQSNKSSWKQFTSDELKKIFEHTHYLAHRTKPDDFWLPLLGLFTGARLNELCQLTHNDIRDEHGVWLVNINDEGDKRVKTIASVRKVPLHSQLISLGFLDYVEDAKLFGGRLFPHLTRNKFGGYSDTPSERWGGYLDKLGITSSQKVFHSLRKTANDRLKQEGVHEEARCQIIGHEFDSINSQVYSEGFSIQQMKASIEKLSYSEIHFEPLKYTQGKFLPFLTRAQQSAQRRANHLKAKTDREARIKK